MSSLTQSLAYAGGIVIGVLLVAWFVTALVLGYWNLVTWRNRHRER